MAYLLSILSGSSTIINWNNLRVSADLNTIYSIGTVGGKEFYVDIIRLTDSGRPLIVSIHTSPPYIQKERLLYDGKVLKPGEGRPFEIDLGCGLTEFDPRGGTSGNILLARTVFPQRGSGVRRFSRQMIRDFQGALKSLGYETTIGL